MNAAAAVEDDVAQKTQKEAEESVLFGCDKVVSLDRQQQQQLQTVVPCTDVGQERLPGDIQPVGH